MVINKADGATRAAASRAATAFKSTLHFHRQARTGRLRVDWLGLAVAQGRLLLGSLVNAQGRLLRGSLVNKLGRWSTSHPCLPARPLPIAPQRRQSWQPVVLTASAHTGLGIDKLQQQLAEYQAVMLHSGELAQVGRGMVLCLLCELARQRGTGHVGPVWEEETAHILLHALSSSGPVCLGALLAHAHTPFLQRCAAAARAAAARGVDCCRGGRAGLVSAGPSSEIPAGQAHARHCERGAGTSCRCRAADRMAQ